MNGRILLTALLSAFAGIVWAGETVLNEKSSRLLNTDGETYVVRESLTFKGDDGTGQSGLSVAEGVHVKIRIEKDATLTCIGGSGANAAAGGDGRTPRFDSKTSQDNGYGISYEVMTFKTASSGAGASQGGGGGAGILVPATSSLTVFGEGALVAKGGAGGAGGKGGASAMGAFHVISWVGLTGSSIGKNWDYLVWSNRFHSADSLETIISGTATGYHYNWWYNAQPASGGGGGGGAGGGGAGIGLPGLAGGEGGNGGAVQSVWGGDDKKILATVSGSPGKVAEGPAAGCGMVRLALSSVTVTGGVGGDAGKSATDGGAKDDQLVWCYDGAGQRSTKVDLYMYNGRAGGGGGGGGAGADFGTGGGGGAGGGGGYSGGIAFNPTNTPSWASNIGTNGLVGAEGNAIQPLIPIGFFVNGTDVGDLSGTGWTYDVKEKILTLNSAMTYVLSGEATNNEVQVHAAASGATAVLSNAVVFASERPAVVVAQGASLMVAANQVLLAGGTPETMRYATDCGQNSCVLAGPAVTVTVKDIPHVADVVVSNRMETISRATVEGGVAYRVMKGDDIFVGYTVEKGYTSKSDNPLVYPAVESDVTVDANTIRVLPHIPYRAWNEATWQMENKVCTNYTVVVEGTQAFADGQWYAVTGAVERGSITVNGAAHLILCDGAKLTATGGENVAGVKVESGNALTIYGQTLGTGELVATCGRKGAGIGSGINADCGSVTINGGTVTAKGGWDGAGIGSGEYWTGTTQGNSEITINGGRVKAVGDGRGAGIGGGWGHHGGVLVINGGTVEAVARWNGGFSLGDSAGEGNLMRVMINGGSVKADKIKTQPTNSANAAVWCVTAKVEGLRVEKLRVEGLGSYGTNDIYAVDNRVYLWLPKGTHRFSISDGTTTYNYCAVMKGVAITVEPLAPVGFFVNGEDIGDKGSGTGWDYNKNMKNLTLSEVGLYVLSGVAMNDEVHIHVAGEKAAGATVILSNAVVFVSGQPPALNVDQNISLLMAGGSSFLGATNNVMAISVGPKAALTVGLAPGADETEAIIGVFNYGDVAAIGGAGSVTVRGGTLAVWADKRAAETPINRTADVLCMLAGNDPETAKVVDTYNGEPYVLVTAAIAPVTPGTPFGPFTTAEAATNAAKKAVINPRDDVVTKLGAGSSALATYCNMFTFAVTGGGESWYAEAALLPEAWTNVVQSAQAATRQIPLADIAALPLNTPTNVTAKSCGVPGFFYSCYSGGTVTNLTALAAEGGRNVLCGPDRDVKFEGVVKPSAAAGFFSIGAKETPGVQPSDGYRRLPIIVPPVLPK